MLVVQCFYTIMAAALLRKSIRLKGQVTALPISLGLDSIPPAIYALGQKCLKHLYFIAILHA